ncbi:MAG: HNH endonuclease [Thermodesulfobacteriota bacterium]|nr:HNH endonuclease [Thermodesulfobacteriota bacterium]
MESFTVDTDERAMHREREKARELRQSQWWKRQLDRGRCHYCGKPFPPSALTMDHIVPVVRGGKSKKGNLVPACKDCNNKKKHMLPIEWEAYLRSLSENDTR